MKRLCLQALVLALGLGVALPPTASHATGAAGAAGAARTARASRRRRVGRRTAGFRGDRRLAAADPQPRAELRGLRRRDRSQRPRFRGDERARFVVYLSLPGLHGNEAVTSGFV